VEKNSIKYPIDDKLILKMPELHGNSALRQPPQLKTTVVEAEEFENLLYIWEFFNNFSDFLSTPSFTLAELQASLNFTLSEDRVHTAFHQEIDSSQEITNDPFQGYTWTQRCTMTEIKERGIHLVNQIHMALVRVIANDLEILNNGGESAGQPPDNQENGMLIHSIMKLNEDQERLWTEMVRLLIAHADERHDIDLEGLQDNVYIADLLRKVGALTPQAYTWSLTYKEKVDVLLFLVDTMHDLDSFRQFLNKRLDDKSSLFKQKNDLHAVIKVIEQEKQEAITEFNKNNQDNDEQINKEVEELNEKLLNATRIESRWINQRIHELMKKKNRLQEEILKYDDLIARKQQKIEKIVEAYQSLNIKTCALGQDAHMNEYWYFKDDPTKIFIKRQILVEKPVRKAPVKGEGDHAGDAAKSLADTAQHQREDSLDKNDHEMDNAEQDEQDQGPTLNRDQTLSNA